MISNKHIAVLALVLTIAVVLGCVFVMGYSDKLHPMMRKTNYHTEYADALFCADEIITIDIQMEQEKWQEMLDNAMSEVYYQCDVVINGNKLESVGIRPKGNTSLASIASDPDNNRYSFKLEFDQFVDGQTCLGLDKLILNNHYADASYMKEALIYDMFAYMNADASLSQYAKIMVNGEYWGLYLALEAVEDSFMVRNYGLEKGYLYKPDGMNMGDREGGGMPNPMERGKFGGRQMPQMPQDGEEMTPPQMPQDGEEMTLPQMPQDGEGRMPSGEFPEGFPGGGGPGGGNGANLNYSDDSLNSYSTIWNGAVNDSTDADHRRVVTALQHVSEGTELETYIDVENIANYMAVHSFSVNEDSLSGSMAHNYYLYESKGKLNVVPWDYNLAFGGMHGNDATAMVNDPLMNLIP
ncbi:MAG: hypothetical protein E7399_05465, partial [Ruminococcaceae bacterium]|nr:hypothetical protein [Oscillospiraceae bacterium]